MVRLVHDGTTKKLLFTEEEKKQLDSHNREVAKLLEQRGLGGVVDLVQFAIDMLHWRGSLKLGPHGERVMASDLGLGSGTYGLLRLANGEMSGYYPNTTRADIERELHKRMKDKQQAAEERAQARRKV